MECTTRSRLLCTVDCALSVSSTRYRQRYKSKRTSFVCICRSRTSELSCYLRHCLAKQSCYELSLSYRALTVTHASTHAQSVPILEQREVRSRRRETDDCSSSRHALGRNTIAATGTPLPLPLPQLAHPRHNRRFITRGQTSRSAERPCFLLYGLHFRRSQQLEHRFV